MNQRTRAEHIIGWSVTALIWLVFCLGASAAWQGTDTLLKINAVLALIACLWLLRVMKLAQYAPWRGSMQFVALWLVFPLFKSIRQVWIHRVFDAELLNIDRYLWGTSLPELASRWENYRLSEVVSFGYSLFYFIVLFPVLWFSWKRHSREAGSFFLGLSLMYFVGFLAYLLIPAGGPFIAFPEIFPYPPEGGPVTAFLADIVKQGVTGMDVFPSLHCGVSLYVLGFFVLGFLKFGNRVYFAVSLVLVAVCVPLILATVYLRFHYGIDLLAGTLLAMTILFYIQKKRSGGTA